MRSLVLLLCLFFSTALTAQTAAHQPPPAPPIAASAYLLVDFNSGQPLVARNAQARVEPASLTKLMTAYLVFTALREKRLRPDQAVPVSPRAQKAQGSRMFVEPKKPVTVDELIRGLIVQSGNDACIALAEAVAGSEEAFAGLMNREAQRLGLRNTHFANSTGLPDPQHYSSAEDLALLAAAVIRDFPDYYPLYSLKEYRYNSITQANRNRLLWSDPTVDGMKTGYTEAAGYCLVSSARRGGRRLLSVVLGAAGDAARAVESQKLLNYGFQQWDGMRLYEGKQAVADLPVYKGAANRVKAGFLSDLHLAVPRGLGDQLKATVESMQPLLAPINAGQRVGTLKLHLNGQPFREVPVVALEDVAPAGIFGRGWDTLRLIFR
jgi:serine-type D-Ala-D-Ala carboxypeptidase (penicillin-binding protein 5/6)